MVNIVLTGYVIIPEADFDAISEAMPEHIRLTLEEPGCLSFKITPDKSDPLRFSVYEEFIDMAALKFHQKRSREGHWHEVTKNMERHFSIMDK